MSTTPSDPLAQLLELVCCAAREGVEQALSAQKADVPAARAALSAKSVLAHSLGVSPATIDRLSRAGRIPFVYVGDARRFDVAAVIAKLKEGGVPEGATTLETRPLKQLREPGVRLLSRKGARGKRGAP